MSLKVKCARTMLRVATGASNQYKEVWDVVMRHAAMVTNNAPETGGKAPVERGGGTRRDVYNEFHPCCARYCTGRLM